MRLRMSSIQSRTTSCVTLVRDGNFRRWEAAQRAKHSTAKRDPTDENFAEPAPSETIASKKLSVPTISPMQAALSWQPAPARMCDEPVEHAPIQHH